MVGSCKLCSFPSAAADADAVPITVQISGNARNGYEMGEVYSISALRFISAVILTVFLLVCVVVTAGVAYWLIYKFMMLLVSFGSATITSIVG